MSDVSTEAVEESKQGMSRGAAIAIAVVVGVVALLLGAVGYALFFVEGTGEGAVTSSDVENLEVEATTVSATLNPGETSDVAVSITNPNTFPVEVTAIEVGDGEAVTGAGTYSEANGNFANLVIAADGGQDSVILADAVTLNEDVTDPTTEYAFPVHVSGAQYVGEEDTTVVVGNNWQTVGNSGSAVVAGDHLTIDTPTDLAYSGDVGQLVGTTVSTLEDVTFDVETVSGTTASRIQFDVVTPSKKLVSMDFPNATSGQETIRMSDSTVTVGKIQNPDFSGSWADFRDQYGDAVIQGAITVGGESSVNKTDSVTFVRSTGTVVVDFQA